MVRDSFEESEEFEPSRGLDWFWQWRLKVFLFKYVAIFIIVVGTFGNIVSLVVLRGRAFKGTNPAFLLSALAVADLGVLHTGLLRIIVKNWTGYDFRLSSTVTCKIHYFLTYAFPHLSSWTVVLVTLERLVSLWRPFEVKVICSHQRVLLFWILISAFIIALNVHLLVTYSIVVTYYHYNDTDVAEMQECVYTKRAANFYVNIWPWVDSLVLSFIPIAIIIPSNLLIVSRVWISRRLRSSGLGAGPPAPVASVTGMLLVISTVFVLTTTPLVLYYAFYTKFLDNTMESLVNTVLARCVCNILFYANSAVNFILYCLSGSQFRVALGATVGCSHRRRANSLNTSFLYTVPQETLALKGRLTHRLSQSSLNDKVIANTLLVPPVRKTLSDSCLSP
ncbi:hypothetical protein CAPTEDRAFT_91699 [Capitella teleta]|uniref:G-protein coupled receptors family 1 profile domain-containing protein n=1 Tax=Capitella teleta TaxID=283909 RepID=R7UB55_CAPTE|nr:hypothetical protein CAPTEDRAFT_91699 [Capitella teleta]|eukprot:ELU00477.1 hypothetical protein CAPTEDRAFT_91699 [Capitella teleta]